MEQIMQYIIEKNLGDLTSVLGFIVALIGFSWTIISVLRSKSATEGAKDAVLKVRDDMRYVETVSEVSTVITAMDEIKRLHREGTWRVLPDRYSVLRKLLISIKASNSDMNTRYKSVFQDAIQSLRSIEKQVEYANLQAKIPQNVAKLNAIISRLIDSLHEILVEIKKQIGR